MCAISIAIKNASNSIIQLQCAHVLQGRISIYTDMYLYVYIYNIYIYTCVHVCVCALKHKLVPSHKTGFAAIFLSLNAVATAHPKPLKISRHSKSS